ncbi:hypothetical protein GCM10011506_27330 [Marivirga lumbricoides]|uniref:Uncharacterized protein n=1 Tax=Marivirga lumbricoides TaxID=1046115 RepID=A0ABQ1MGD4_9BACT|nr:hypothetical protein GCM10011506_27330 [Marivirga lumbricoides]
MKKTILFLLISLNTSVALLAQEKLLFKLDEAIEGFNKSSTSTFYAPKRKKQNTSVFPARIEITDVIDGFILRTDLNVKKFNFQGDKIWEVNMASDFTMSQFPYMYTAGDDKMTYIFEIQTNLENSKKIKVSAIDASGNLTETVLKSDINKFNSGTALHGMGNALEVYVNNGELRILAKKSARDIEYRLYTFKNDSKTLEYQVLNLPVNEYEKKESDAYTALRKPLMWNYLTSVNGKDIFYKTYFKDIKKNKDKEAIVNLVEFEDTKIGIVKNLEFNSDIINDAIKFSVPSILYNHRDNSFHLIGNLEANSRKINGVYLMKYDLKDLHRIYSKQHYFLNILKPEIKTELKPHYQIPEQVHSVYPLNFREADVLFSTIHNTTLRVVTNYNLKSITFFELKFSALGEHQSTQLVQYNALISLHDKIIPNPKIIEKVWSNGEPEEVNVWNYINSQAKDNKDFNIFWHPLKYSSKAKLVKIDQEKGTFHLVEVN